MSSALHALAAHLRSEDTVVSPHVTDPAAPAALGTLVAAGPAAADDPDAYALVIESVREGYLLHYGEPRVIVGADPDLRLLAGDYLYAIGLEQLAGLGDLPAVRELSDLISIGAQLHADADAPRPAPAGEALWLASTLAIATGEPTIDSSGRSLAESEYAAQRARSNPDRAASARTASALA